MYYTSSHARCSTTYAVRLPAHDDSSTSLPYEHPSTVGSTLFDTFMLNLRITTQILSPLRVLKNTSCIVCYSAGNIVDALSNIRGVWRRHAGHGDTPVVGEVYVCLLANLEHLVHRNKIFASSKKWQDKIRQNKTRNIRWLNHQDYYNNWHKWRWEDVDVPYLCPMPTTGNHFHSVLLASSMATTSLYSI